MSAVLSSSSVHSAVADAAALDVRRLSGRIGAEIRGVRLSSDLEPATFAAIHQALLRHKVLFLRGQQHLDDAEHQAFGRLWGEIEPHPTVPSPDGTRLLELDSRHGGRANSWHTDVTFEVAPPKVAVLRAVTIPELGGDTLWANTVAAYAGLPEALKNLAGTLRAVHGNDYDYAGQRPDGGDEAGREKYRKVFTSTLYEAEHPVVRVHPETGERALLLGHFAKKLVGYSSHDSQRLIEIFNAHILRSENTVRWHWAQGDVAIWDNRATQHYAINDYGDAHRVVRRVTVSGEVPVGADGRRSTALTAQPAAIAATAAIAAAAAAANEAVPAAGNTRGH
jgi:alpha-ketoglutarate-dependent taurine dioxygenase